MEDSTHSRKNWLETKEKLKKKFVKLTDYDLLFEDDSQTEMMERLQQKLGLSKEEIHKVITKL